MRTVAQPGLAGAPPNFRFVRIGATSGIDADEVLEGLSRTQKSLPAKLLYDARGSELFNAICETEAYYPTRTERAIFLEHAGAMAEAIGADSVIVEPGSGEMSKVRMLLPALRPSAYVGMDVSEKQLISAGTRLAADYAELDVLAVCGDFGRLDAVSPHVPAASKRVAFFPGSTIGNLDPARAREFLSVLFNLVGDDGVAIVGVDLRKAKAVLDLAYNDPEGYTRAFNLNLLTRLNRDLGGDFDERRFQHHAFYDEARGRIEMHLVSMVAQKVRIANREITFAPGESIHTESSYKYEPQAFAALAGEAGFETQRLWTDAREYFGVFLLARN
ncbi:MAG: L-histidine N(alpha)-methyltransferase [Burkholderiales bacterium]